MAKKRSNGEGSFYKRSDGRWVAAYTDQVTRKRQYVYGKTQKEVKIKLKELMNDSAEETQEVPAEAALPKEEKETAK